MAKVWMYKHGEDEIAVTNKLESTDLTVNNKVQDRKNGIMLTADLKGKTTAGKEIRASVGGLFTVDCSLFIDNELQTPIRVID